MHSAQPLVTDIFADLPTQRTRIKVCGFTRAEDLQAAQAAGIDAVGFVCYPKSPRYVNDATLKTLSAHVEPFVVPVLLFVNASIDAIANALALCPRAVVQLHGDETPEFCAALHAQLGCRYIKVIRVKSGEAPQLLQYVLDFPHAGAFLLDTFVDSYGGSGSSFDWNSIPWLPPAPNAAPRLVLSGGLTPSNVAEAIHMAKPHGGFYAVDVSSGVELSKGIKDPTKIHQFVQAVQRADLSPQT